VFAIARRAASSGLDVFGSALRAARAGLLVSSQISPAPAGHAGAARSPSQFTADDRGADRGALEQLLVRCLPHLRRWAHGRLPRWARRAADTADLIQDTVLRTLSRLDAFQPRHPNALGAYLREAVRNRIRDEHRRVARHGIPVAMPDAIHDPAPSPLDAAISSALEGRYRAALARLTPKEQELIVAHLELGYSHDQLACMIGRSRNAARMALRRAVCRLAEHMRDR
jgi:RNA polymerase sigma factor (sigma-70 family)